MSSYLLVMVALMIALGTESTGTAVAFSDPAIMVMGVIVAACLAPIPGVFLARWVHKEVMHGTLGRKRRRYLVFRILCWGFLLGDFAAITHLLGWAGFVDSFGLAELVSFTWLVRIPPLAVVTLLDELLKLLPFLVMLLMCWVPMYRIDITLRRGPSASPGTAKWSLRDYVVFHFRQYVLFILVPFSLVVMIQDTWHILPVTLRNRLTESGVVTAFILAGVGLALVVLPLLLRYEWKTRPLSSGPLRERLEALLARTHLACRQILLWDTYGGQMVNACVTGFVGLTRYIFLTDTLIDALDADEIVAVFAHEIGHVKRHHMWFYIMFAGGFVLILAGGQALLGLGTSGVLFVLGLMVVYWGFGFGYLSRRMEVEADLYAAEVCGGVFDFVNSLEKIALASGKSRSAGSWRHFSIERRVNFLVDTVGDVTAVATFRREARLLKALCVLIAVATVLTALFFPDFFRAGL